ncbi:MAG: hypothetical protein GY862_09095 [Gammaproteobacteria bacterium]|nr:hypothetical protein [Gammaproteobacteria bacterium]
MPIRSWALNVARTSDVGAVGEIGRLLVPTLSALDRVHLGLSSETLRGADADLGSHKAAAIIEAAAAIVNNVAAAAAAATAADYR